MNAQNRAPKIDATSFYQKSNIRGGHSILTFCKDTKNALTLVAEFYRRKLMIGRLSTRSCRGCCLGRPRSLRRWTVSRDFGPSSYREVQLFFSSGLRGRFTRPAKGIPVTISLALAAHSRHSSRQLSLRRRFPEGDVRLIVQHFLFTEGSMSGESSRSKFVRRFPKQDVFPTQRIMRYEET